MSGVGNHGAACVVCGGAGPFEIVEGVRDFEYGVIPERRMQEHRCAACGSDFLYPRPTDAELEAYYPADYHAFHDDHGWLARFLVGLRGRFRARAYSRMLDGRSGALFDVGVGDCRHFDALHRHANIECSGVEIVPDVAARARARGYDVVTGTLETMDIDRHIGRYDIVSMNHVLEHVVSPHIMLGRAFALLKPGGRVIGQLPSASCWERDLFGKVWAGYHFPRHLQAFSQSGLRDLLRRSGFADIAVRTAPHLQSALSVQNALIAAGWRPRMRFGKTPIYSLLLMTVMPFELAAYLSDKGGIMNFSARVPR